jgi:hypothetical protein
MLRAGWRLLCAGDTFIHHDGHRSFWLTGSNRTARRLGVDGGEIAQDGDPDPGLVKDSNGRVFEVRGRVASHVESDHAVKLIGAGRTISAISDAELAGMTIGPPICACRVRGSDEVWVLQAGARRRVSGDKHRIRRLSELSMVEGSELAELPRAADVAVEDALPPVPEIRSRLPFNPAAIRPETLASAERVAEEIGDALERGTGYALIRLDDEAVSLLNEGMWAIEDAHMDPAAREPDVDLALAARAIREAIIDADAVGVTTSTEPFGGARVLEQLLLHFELYPRLRCSAEINYQLFGVDRTQGVIVARSLLAPVLGGRALALVGPSTLMSCVDWSRRAQLQQVGIDLRLAVSVDDLRDLPRAVSELSGQRDSYDAVLAATSASAKPLCTRVARDLGVVALDIGRALDRTLCPGYDAYSPRLVAQRYLRDYLRELAAPPPPPHELDGRLIRQPGEAAVYYVERGAARGVPHRELLQLFEDEPIEIDHEAFASLRQGVPLFVVHERSGATYLVIEGTRRSLGLGLPLASQYDATLDVLAEDGRVIHWYPGAGPGLAGRAR